jgi:hypothetical protein
MEAEKLSNYFAKLNGALILYQMDGKPISSQFQELLDPKDEGAI